MAWYDTLADLFGNQSGSKAAEEAAALDALIQAGIYQPTYTPEAVGQTGLSQIQEDPRLRSAQMGALENLQSIATQGGMTAIDRARMEQINREAAMQEQAQRQAILANARARGVGGSGLEMAGQLAAQQGGAQMRGMQGTNVAAEAQRRALEAMQQAGGVAGNIRGQDYGVAADRARAQDIINRFNVANRNDAAQNRERMLNQNRQLQADVRSQREGYYRNRQDESDKGFWRGFGELLNQGSQIGSRYLPVPKTGV